MMSEWTFAHPEWGGIFGLALALAWLHRRFFPDVEDDRQAWRQLHRLSVRHPLVSAFLHGAREKTRRSVLQRKTASRSWLSGILTAWRWLLLAGGALVLMEPGRQAVDTVAVVQTGKLNLAYVVETSVTFLLQDYQAAGQPTDRLEAVRQALADTVAAQANSRFSLTLFADRAGVLLPPTGDRQLFLATLKRLKPYLMGRTDEGSAEALALALQMAPQAVVLISDGLNRPPVLSLTQVVAYARERGVPIFVVGVGAGRPAHSSSFAGLIYQPLEDLSLRRLAQSTGGRYIPVDRASALKAALQAIAQEKVQRWTVQRTHRRWHSWQRQALIVWLALLAVYVGLSLLVIHREEKTRHDAVEA